MVGPALHSEGHPMEIRGMAVAAGDPAMRGPGFRTALWVLFGVLTLLGMYYQVQGASVASGRQSDPVWCISPLDR
jgi:hypothetical protein